MFWSLRTNYNKNNNQNTYPKKVKKLSKQRFLYSMVKISIIYKMSYILSSINKTLLNKQYNKKNYKKQNYKITKNK